MPKFRALSATGATAAVLGCLLFVSCTVGRDTEPSPTSPTESGRQSSPSLAEDTVQVSCLDPGAGVATPLVLVQRDGLHFNIRNDTGQALVVEVAQIEAGQEIPGEFASVGDSIVESGREEKMTWVVPPGVVGVACVRTGQPPGQSELLRTMARVQVLDPEEFYVPIDLNLDCESAGVETYGLSLPQQIGDPDEPIRVVRARVQGLLSSDTLERAGYPEQRHIWVLVIRAERDVALVDFGLTDNTGTVTSCRDSGVYPK